MLSKNAKNVQKKSNFALGAGLSDDTADSREHDQLTVLLDVHKKCTNFFNFAIHTELSYDTAAFGEQDWLIIVLEIPKSVQRHFKLAVYMGLSSDTAVSRKHA